MDVSPPDVTPGRLSTFIDQLHADGIVVVMSTGPSAEEDSRDLEAALTRACDRAVLDAPAGMPQADRQSACRAFAVLYDLCRFVINRHLLIESLTAAAAPWDSSAATLEQIVGVDVAFRHLHAVHRQAAERNAEDPLVVRLITIARAWPLSAIGIPGTGDDPGTLLEHPGLRALYVDRLIALGDVGRARHPRVLPHLRAAVGAFPDLVPALREVLV